MSSRKELKPMPLIGDPADPEGFCAHVQRYLTWMGTRNYAKTTMINRQDYLIWFMQWADERGLHRPNQITKPILERYQRHLYLYRKANGEPLSFRSQHMRLSALKCLFKWLTQQNYLLYNPASEIELPKLEKRLPRHVLTSEEVEDVLKQPDLKDLVGVRDRAILETFYSTGIRRTELINLSLYDLDYARGTLLVREGKGKKDRVIPIGERALVWIKKYTYDVRPNWIIPPDGGTLFLTHDGEAISQKRMGDLVKAYLRSAGIEKPGSCHLFRHSMATLMLENGADIRFIQAMLGHAELTTTQIYTQVSIQKLKDIHTMTHPAKWKQ